MITSKQLQASFMLLAAAGVATALPVSAATTDNTQVSLAVAPGQIEISIPNPSYTLSGITLNNTAQTSVTDIPFTISDYRGTLGGWTSTFKYTNLAGQTLASKKILLASDVSANFGTASKYLAGKVKNVAVTGGPDLVSSLTTYNSSQTISSLSALTNVGYSNNFNLLDAPSNQSVGGGSYGGTIETSLTIPAKGEYPAPTKEIVTAQSYSGTLTVDISGL